MKSRLVKSLAILFVGAVMCVGNAFALNPIPRDDSGRVTVGQNGYGDVLLGQVYQTLTDYETRIQVINSSSNVAVVAHVTFRSAVYCCDVFDFALYLTPTDMWEATVRMNDAGNVEIYSEDDSVMSSELFDWDGVASCNPFKGVWASEETPLHREFYTDCLVGGDINTMGHFEVVGIAAFPATAPLSKDTLAMAYGNIPGVPAVAIGNLIACDFNLNGTAIDVPNVLTGTVTLENAAFDEQQSSVNLIALKNWENAARVDYTIGDAYDLDRSDFNSVVEIEAALAKTEYAVPFNFDTDGGDTEVILLNTLATRYEADQGLSGYPGLVGGICGVQYQVYDMQETIIMDFLSGDVSVECLPEVSMQPLRDIVSPAFQYGYTKGWVRVGIDTQGGGTGLSAAGVNDLGNVTFVQYIENGYSYGDGAGTDVYPYVHRVAYTGVPVINSSLTVDADYDLTWNYAASPESTVIYYEDIDGDGNIDVHEDVDGDGVLDAGEDVDGDGNLDVLEDANLTGVNGAITVRQ